MFLDAPVAQKLVDRMMESLGCNVNMMDGRGVIIASGEPDRIGKLHVGACLVLERKETVQCFDTTDAGAESTQPGINMPLCHAGEVVGVVGVTGDPHQLEHMARLVKLTAELLMEQEFANDQKLSDQTAKTSYVNRLISLASPQDAQSVRLWAERHGYDMDQPRAVCLLAAQPLAGRRRPASMHDAVLRSVERMPGFSAQDIAAYLGGKQVVLLKTAPVGRTRQARAELERFFETLRADCVSQGIALRMACGSVASAMERVPESFEEARFLMEWPGCAAPGIYHIQDWLLCWMVRHMPELRRSEALREALGLLRQDEELTKTVIALSSSEMSPSAAAERLYVHRNTVAFRMQRLKEQTGLDPLHCESDRLRLHILAALLQIDRENAGANT